MIFTLFIINDKIINIPIRTLCWIIINNMWFSSKILPIMSIDTKAFIMLCKIIRTHFSFIMKNIKISVSLIIMNKFYLDISIGVSKGTEFTVFAVNNIIGIVRTKPFFVFFRVVENFYSIMGLCTEISIWTTKFL